jgi:MFS family permease
MSFTSRTRWSDLYVSAVAQFFGALGTFLTMVTLVLALQRRGAGGVEVAGLVLCEALPMVLLGKLIGALIDRLDSRRLLIAAGTGQVVACLGLTVAGSYPAILAGAAALSVTSGVAIPTRQALLPAMVTRDQLPRASAIGQTAGSLGLMLGPALAGLLFGSLGPQSTIRLAAIGFLATVIAGITIRTRRGGRPARSTAEGQGGAWSLASDRLLWSSAWSVAAVLAAISAVNVVLVFFIMRTLAGSEATYGLVDSMWTVGLLTGAWVCSRLVRPTTDDRAVGRRLLAALGLISAAIVLVGVAPAAAWLVPCYLIGGAANAGINVLTGTLIGRRAPAEARGRANAALAVRLQGGSLLGYIAGGLLLEVADPRSVILGCGALGIVTALATAHFLRGDQFRPDNPPRTPASTQTLGGVSWISTACDGPDAAWRRPGKARLQHR